MDPSDISTETTRRLVCVPDLPWPDLVAAASRKLGRARVHPLLQEDLYRGERGRTYEALAWKPGRVMHGSDVRSALRAQGFEGNPAVFVAWAMSVGLSASHDRCITVPCPDRLFSYKGKDDLALCLLRGYQTCGFGSSLTVSRVGKPMHTQWTFVAFREADAPRPG